MRWGKAQYSEPLSQWEQEKGAEGPSRIGTSPSRFQ